MNGLTKVSSSINAQQFALISRNYFQFAIGEQLSGTSGFEVSGGPPAVGLTTHDTQPVVPETWLGARTPNNDVR